MAMKRIYVPVFISCSSYCRYVEKEQLSLNSPEPNNYPGSSVLSPFTTRPWSVIQHGSSYPPKQHHANHDVTVERMKPYKLQYKAKQQCQICNKIFARSSSLIVHMRGHTGERPYKCSYCPKAFAQSANLTTQQRTHTGQKPYECSVCGKCFSQSSSVTTNMRIHTGERPFQCAKCGMAFTERSTLSKHYRVHTKNHKVTSDTKPSRGR